MPNYNPKTNLRTLLNSLFTGISVIGAATGAVMATGVYANVAYGIPASSHAGLAKQTMLNDTPTDGMIDGRDAGSDLPVSTSDWQAFDNQLPIGFPTLYVEGEVRLPNPGYDADLMRPIEQNLLDDALTLILQIDEPDGNFVYPQVVTPVSVRYEDEFYVGDYEQVIVRGEDGSVIETVEIQSVQ